MSPARIRLYFQVRSRWLSLSCKKILKIGITFRHKKTELYLIGFKDLN